MDSSIASSALQPPSTSMLRLQKKSVNPIVRQPLAIKDPNLLPARKSSLEKTLILREPIIKSKTGSSMTKGNFARNETVPLVKTKTLEQLMHDYRMQQHQLSLLQQEFTEYKAETNKTMETHLFDRFEGIKKHDIMTQFACKWFGILMVAHVFFYYCYFILRKGSQAFVDDDEVSSAKETVVDGIYQVSIYSMVYLFIVLFDIFCLVVFPDRVRCERTTAHSHVIVAAHRARESLETMLPTVLRTFSPECVWVADNGFQDKESEELCKRLGVNYDFNPVGNKANALVVVARKIKRRHGDAVKNGMSCFLVLPFSSTSCLLVLVLRFRVVVLLDDDTELEDDFFVRHDILADPSTCCNHKLLSLLNPWVLIQCLVCCRSWRLLCCNRH